MKNNLYIRKIQIVGVLGSLVTSLVTPLSVRAQTNPLNISFGGLLTAQEENGYDSFSGSSAIEYFNQAKAELPTEVPVIESFEPQGNNVFFVSNDGNDQSDGSKNSPLATIDEALNRVSALTQSQKANGSIIYLREGEYNLDNTVNITDKHTDLNSVLYIGAYNGEEVSFTTNRITSLSKAEQMQSNNTKLAMYSRIPLDVRENIYFIDYEEMGVDDIPYESIFYMNDMPMFVARYPNHGTDTVKNVIKDGSYIESEGFTRTGLLMEWENDSNEPFKWEDTLDIHIFGRIANEWSLTDGRVYFDKFNKTIKSTSGSLTPNYSPVTTNFWGSIPSTYYYTNVFEELDSRGEWFADNKNGRFYFYMPENTDIENSYISFDVFEGYTVNISGADNVVIDNIEISGTDKGIKIENSENVLLQNMDINKLKSTAVNIYSSKKCGLINSYIADVKSSAAVSITESDEGKAQLIPRRNFIQNSCIANVHYAVGVSLSSGNIISHNVFENTRNNGITLSGAENIIEYNEFSGVANRITDSGGIYVGGDILNRGNTIRYNYFHDSRPDKMNARAIYCDDCSDMNWIYGNVIKNFSYGIFLHSGDDHVVMDNTVINTNTYIRNSADYALQQTLMENYFFSNSPQFVRGYENNNIANSNTWLTRYKGILKEKYEQVLEAKAAYNTDKDGMFGKVYSVLKEKKKTSDSNVQKVCDLVADTGCYYKNNTYVVPKYTYNNGYGPSDCGLYNTCDSRPTVKYNSASFDVSSLTANMGNVTDIGGGVNKPFIYLEDGSVYKKSEFTGISWTDTDRCSLYTLEIALDNAFNNVVVSYKTSEKEYAVEKYIYDSETGENKKEKTVGYDFLNDVKYYARVKATSLAKGGETATSDTVTFTISENVKPKSQTQTEEYYGTSTGKIKISGKVPDYILNESDRQISFIVYNKAEGTEENTILHIAQINPEEDGSFSYTFGSDITDQTRLRIRAGQDDITDELFSQSVNSVTEISLELNEQELTTEKIISAAARINNMFGITDGCSVIIAAYDKDGKLIGCNKTDTGSVALGDTEAVNTEYIITEEVAQVKAFLWDMSKMKPLTGSVHAKRK